MLELKNISYIKDDKEILKDINLTIDENKFIAITGPNGSGKSSLAKIIMGINTPTSGKIFFNGEDITDKNITERAKLGIGFAFQQPVKFKGITVRDLINMAAGRKMQYDEIKEYLQAVGLCAKEYINRQVDGSLSGGELKRIEIATVAAKQSKLTIFDEPEAGIDLWSFNNLIDVFEEIHETIKGSIVIISHQERILDISDEIILLQAGKIKEVGTKEEMLPKLLMRNKSCKCSKGGRYE